MNSGLEKPFQCTACFGKGSRTLFRVGPGGAYGVVLCTSCGLVHLLPKPNERSDGYQLTNTADYAAAVHHLHPGFDHHHGVLLRRLSCHSPPPGRLLEIGCGKGDFLVRAKAAGYDVCGVEPAVLDPHVKTGAGIRILNETIEQVSLPNGYFDVAVAIQVIEHMHDPWLLCEKMAHALKPGGILYLETPNFDALARRFHSPRFMNLNVAPGHWHLFNGQSLRRLVRRVGIESLLSWTFFKALSAYGHGPVRPALVSVLNAVLGPLGLANTLAVMGRKRESR